MSLGLTDLTQVHQHFSVRSQILKQQHKDKHKTPSYLCVCVC